MKLKIVLYPDPILGKVCSPIPEITDEIRTLARDMLETMSRRRSCCPAGGQAH